MARTIAITYDPTGASIAKQSVAFTAGEDIRYSLSPATTYNATGHGFRLVIADTTKDAPLVNTTTVTAINLSLGTFYLAHAAADSFEWTTGVYHGDVWLDDSGDKKIIARITAKVTGNPSANGELPTLPDYPVQFSEIAGNAADNASLVAYVASQGGLSQAQADTFYVAKTIPNDCDIDAGTGAVGGTLGVFPNLQCLTLTASSGTNVTIGDPGKSVNIDGQLSASNGFNVQGESQFGGAVTFADGDDLNYTPGASINFGSGLFIVNIADGTATIGADTLSATGDVTIGGGLIASGGIAVAGTFLQTLTDATTSGTTTTTTFQHNSSGTPAAGFGSVIAINLHTTTTTNTPAADLTVTWATATHASRKARVVHQVYDTSARETFREEASGSAAMISFYGVSAVARQASPDIATSLVNLGLLSGSPTYGGQGPGFTTSDATAVATGKIKGFSVIPYNATITGWSIVVDAGTATVKVWKIASGTAKPTSANSINTSGVAISTGTAIISSTTSDFTTTTITAGDILAYNIEAISGVKEITFQLKLVKSS